MVGRIVEIIEAGLTEQATAARRRHLAVADVIGRIDRNGAKPVGIIGSGVQRIYLRHVGVVADQRARCRPANVGARACRDCAAVDAERRRNPVRPTEQAAVNVLVTDKVVPAELVIVAVTDLRLGPAGLDRRIDADRDRGIGHDIAGIQVRVEQLPDLNIRHDRRTGGRLGRAVVDAGHRLVLVDYRTAIGRLGQRRRCDRQCQYRAPGEPIAKTAHFMVS